MPTPGNCTHRLDRDDSIYDGEALALAFGPGSHGKSGRPDLGADDAKLAPGETRVGGCQVGAGVPLR